MTGAPQWHDQNFTKSIATYLDHGRKYNNNYGYYGDRYLTERRNFYHKPVFNLNWDYTIDEKSSLSTVLYASTGNGGGTGGRGRSPSTSRPSPARGITEDTMMASGSPNARGYVPSNPNYKSGGGAARARQRQREAKTRTICICFPFQYFSI